VCAAVNVYAPILLSLVPGCWLAPCDSDLVEREATFTPSWFDLAAELDGDGQLTAAGCENLCERYSTIAVTSVEECGFEDEEVGAVTVPADTADTASTPPTITCRALGTRLCDGGRHHVSVAARAMSACSDALGAFLAESALAEATSVTAFVALAAELSSFGAPADLVERCKAAAVDEVVHARLLGAAAAARGASVPRATFTSTPRRTLLRFAVENAVEGCVNETWATVVAAHQSVHAEDASLRAIYRRIARDEARHAELAWALHAWLTPLLAAEDRAEVEVARAAAIEALSAQADGPRVAGLPGGSETRRLLAGLLEQVWTPAAAAARTRTPAARRATQRSPVVRSLA